MHVLGAYIGCAVIAYPQGLRRNTAAMLELRCCCRGMRYGCFRWWWTKQQQGQLSLRKSPDWIASFCLGLARSTSDARKP